MIPGAKGSLSPPKPKQNKGQTFSMRLQLYHQVTGEACTPRKDSLGSGPGLQRLEAAVPSCQGQPRGLCQTRHHQLFQQLGFYCSALTKASPLAAWWQNSQGFPQQHPQQTEPSRPSANCSGCPTALPQSQAPQFQGKPPSCLLRAAESKSEIETALLCYSILVPIR